MYNFLSSPKSNIPNLLRSLVSRGDSSDTLTLLPIVCEASLASSIITKLSAIPTSDGENAEANIRAVSSPDKPASARPESLP